jgi:hypothetical protein
MPGLVLLQLSVSPLMLAERQDLGFPDPGEVGEPDALTVGAGAVPP